MNKTTRILFVTFAVLLVIHVGLSVAFSHAVYDTAADLRRQQTRDMLSLGARNEKAESLNQLLQEHECEKDVSIQACACACSCTDQMTAKEHIYTLRAYRDVIGVFDHDNNLIRVINVYCASLPEADQAALKVGIEVSSWDEVSRLLEVYS